MLCNLAVLEMQHTAKEANLMLCLHTESIYALHTAHL